MRRSLPVSAGVAACLLIAGSVAVSVRAERLDHYRRGAVPGKERIEQALGQLPLSFIENRGQVDPRVQFYIQGSSTSLYFTSRGMTYSLSGDKPNGMAGRHAVKLDFLEADPQVGPVGEARAPEVVSFFRGPEESWVTGVPTCRSIAYRDLWPGIDLLYSGTGSGLEYTFLVSPGADPSVIRFAYRGVSGLGLTEGGGLSITTPTAEIAELPPYSYQDIDGRRVPVRSAFSLRGSTPAGSPVLGFDLGGYDPTRPLVIDPVVIVYAGFIGGRGDDGGRGIAVDATGNAYVAGSTESPNFPVKAGPDLTYNGGFDDAFVAKVESSGQGLVYAGYIGGAGDDEGNGVAVADAGNAYVTGFTESAEDTFPVTGGPDLTYNDEYDAFVAKVAPTGESLLYAGYLGGQNLDEGNAIDVDAAGTHTSPGSPCRGRPLSQIG